jgi:L-seryl-tRNA(Ser) seleniumtransferase
MGIYESLGVPRVINADARLTRLGGSKMPDEVLDAMRAAADRYVDMRELQEAVGRRLAKLTNNEAAYVTTGAAAGIVVATLAAMNGGDLRQIARGLEGHLPERRTVLIQRAHRIPYDVVARLAGAEIVEVGNAIQTFDWELEAALDGSVAMILWVAGEHLQRGALPLDQTVAIARRHGVPVVVDAAAQLPPAESLWRFTRDLGADAAIFRGGKELRGPQASGLVDGNPEFRGAMAANGSPNQRLGRPMKVGKE